MSYHSTPWDDIEEPFYSPDYSPRRDNNSEILKSPQGIYNYLDERVYGQEEYKIAISVFVYKALCGINSEKTILVASESGSGKSFLAAQLAELLPGRVITADSSSITPSGFKGSNHFTTILSKVPSDGESYFVILDEINRFFERGLGSSWDSSTGLISELLLLLDTHNASVNCGTDEKPCWINPSHIYFILLGSFSNLTDCKANNPIGFNASISTPAKRRRTQITKEQIIEYLEQWPEILGRIPRIIVNQNLSESDFVNMLKSPKYSPISKLEKELGLSIHVSNRKIKEFGREAYESGQGFRKVRNCVLEIVDNAIFNDEHTSDIYIK